MTFALDPPILRAGLVIAALCRRRVRHLALAGALAVSGDKEPVAVLLHDGTALRGIDMTGTPLAPEAVRRLLPEAEAQLAARWHAAYGGGADG